MAKEWRKIGADIVAALFRATHMTHTKQNVQRKSCFFFSFPFRLFAYGYKMIISETGSRMSTLERTLDRPPRKIHERP